MLSPFFLGAAFKVLIGSRSLLMFTTLPSQNRAIFMTSFTLDSTSFKNPMKLASSNSYFYNNKPFFGIFLHKERNRANMINCNYLNSYSRRLLHIVFLCYLHQLILKEKKMFENMQTIKTIICRITVTLWISELTDFVIASVFSIFFWSLATSAWFLSYWVVSFCLLSLCLEYPLISFSTSLIFFSSSSIYQKTIQIN